MTDKEIAEAINSLKFERIGERSMRDKIITGWIMKTTLNGREFNFGEASAFIKVNGTLEVKDKEEALNSAESFAKSIFMRSLEKPKRMIEKREKRD